jgi:Tfp pilus assembly protein PilN
MADIDMIPREYRDGVRVRRTLRLAGIALALVVAAGALGGIGLRWRTAALERSIAALQASAAQAQADSARDAQQQADRMRREQDLAILRTLRRKGELTALAHGLDAALGDGVWLTELRVERDIQAVSGAAGTGAADVPVNEGIEEFTAPGEKAATQTWRMRSSIELSGQASSYGAVTDFLSALGHQPGIVGLRLVSSSAAAEGGTIDFRATGALVQQGTAQ